jgi:hypothetical protein
VVVGTDAFTSLARTAAAAEGMPHLAHVTVAHPIGGLDPAVVARRADALPDDVLAALTRDRAPAVATAAEIADRVAAPGDLDDFQRFALDRGWGDGLPVLPPTPERVARVLTGWSGARDQLVAALAPRFGLATIEMIAVKDRSPEDEISIAPAPEDVMVIVAGGPGKHAAIIPTFGATRG